MGRARALSAALLVGAVLLHPGSAAAEFSLLGLKNSLVQFALDQVSTPDEFEITAEGVEEPGDGVTDLVGVEISDGRGPWLTADRLSLRWDGTGLLSGRLEIQRLAAENVVVSRAPDPAGVDVALKEDSVLAQDDGDPFDWPRAPIAVIIDELRLDGVAIAEGVIAEQSLAFDAVGAARDQGDAQEVSFTVTRSDAVAGEIELGYLRDFDGDTLTLRLTASEAPGGLVAEFAGFPEDSASRFDLNADGPLSAWGLTFAAGADRVFDAEGTATLKADAPIAVAADFALTPGEALSPAVAAALSPAARLTVAAQEGENGTIALERAEIRAADIDLTASGDIRRADLAMDLVAEIEARSGLADLAEGVAFDRLGFDGTLTGTPQDLTAEGALSLAGLETAAADVARAALSTRIAIASPPPPEDAPDAPPESAPETDLEGSDEEAVGGAVTVDFDLAGDAEGLRLDRLTPELLGRAALTARGRYDGAEARLETLSLASPVLSADASGAVDLTAETALLSYRADAPDLAPIAQAYGATATGAIALEGRLAGPLSAPRLTGSATLEDASFDGEPLGRARLSHDATFGAVPEGEARLTADGSRYGPAEAGGTFRIENDVLSLADLSARALGGEIAGAVSVRLGDGLADGALKLSIPDLSTLAPALGQRMTGRADGALTLAAAEGQSADLTLDARGVTAGDARLAQARLSARGTQLTQAAPRIAATLAARGATAGPAMLDTLDLTARGPLEALDLTLAAAGAVEDAPLSADLAARARLTDELSATVRRAEARYDEEVFALTAPLTVTQAGADTELKGLALSMPGGALSGDATLHGRGFSGDLNLSLEEFGLLRRLAGAPLDDGSATAALTFDTRPGRQTAEARLAARNVGAAGALAEEGALGLDATAVWDGRGLDADAALSGPFGDPLQVEARLPLTSPEGGVPTPPPGAEIDGRARWRGDVGALWALVPAPDHVLDGDLAFDLTLSGPLAAPDVAGDLSLSNGRYENLELGAILTALEAASAITAEGGFAVEATARDGAEGVVTARAALDDGRIDAAVTSDRAVLIRRDDVTAEVSLDLALDGPLAGPRLAGEVRLDRTEVRLVSAGAPTIPSLGEVEIAGAPPPDETEQEGGAVALDLAVTAPDDLFVRGRGLDSEWTMDLRVAGDTADPIVTGAIERVRGRLTLLGQPFELERGRVAFTGSAPPDPTLDVALTRETDGLTGGLVVSGRASAPEIGFASQPAIPEEDVLPRLLFNRTQASLRPLEALQLANGLATLFDGSGGTTDSIRGAVGLDLLRLDDDGGSTGVSAGADVTDGVFVGVRQPIDGGSPSVQVEVEVFDDVTVDSEVGAGDGASFGLNWRKDF